MNPNPLLDLQALGQSIWIDFIRRGMITSGELKRLIDEDGVSGVTSNPSIFEKAIGESQDYDESIQKLTGEGKSAGAVYQSLAVEDIQMVADLLRPTYLRTEGQDGFVSLEVSPTLAHDTNGTIEEARRLWREFRDQGWNEKEPGPGLAGETATRYRRQISGLVANGRIARGIGAELLGVEEEEVERLVGMG